MRKLGEASEVIEVISEVTEDSDLNLGVLVTQTAVFCRKLK